nr:MAG TPA: hypothetical protein [Caudoviricetes sp.]
MTRVSIVTSWIRPAAGPSTLSTLCPIGNPRSSP